MRPFRWQPKQDSLPKHVRIHGQTIEDAVIDEIISLLSNNNVKITQLFSLDSSRSNTIMVRSVWEGDSSTPVMLNVDFEKGTITIKPKPEWLTNIKPIVIRLHDPECFYKMESHVNYILWRRP